MKFVDLLENYIILKERDRNLYYDIKDNIDFYMDFINNNLSYNLIVKDDFIKLEKVPTIPESWMGIKTFNEKKEYIFFIILLMFLEDKNKEEQFVLSSITEYIEHNYESEKIEWTVFKNRKGLVNVLNYSLEIGIIKKTDGDEDEFTKSEYGEVLYENTGISRYIVRRFNREVENTNNCEDLLKEGFEGVSEDSGIIRKNRAYRKLLLTPIVYNEGSDDCDYDYIRTYKSSIKSAFEKYLDWDVHIHRNGALAVVRSQASIKDTFPSKKGESAIVLFISKEIRRLLDIGKLTRNEGDIIRIKKEDFDNILLSIKKEKGSGFTKTFRECSDEYFISSIKSFMEDYYMIRIDHDFIELMPLIGKIIGEYPNDYKGDEE